MSTLGNKGDKNQGKYKAIDINNLYKGTSVSPQKPTPGQYIADKFFVEVVFWNIR